MNHKLWASVGARVVALAFVVGGAAACSDDTEMSRNESNGGPLAQEAAVAPSPSAQVIGTPPAEPVGEPAATAPVASNTSDLSKAEESRGMPNEGDNHSYSTTAEVTPQKAKGVNPQEIEEGKKQ